MSPKFNITILVAPLDWGLGHAARCVPLIRYLLNSGCEVIIASEGPQQQLLQMEFPSVKFVVLEGYRMNYTRSKRLFALKVLLQVPKILKAIRNENKWLRAVVKKYNIDAIVSDNRYGLWHTHIPSVFITHQLRIKAPAIVENWIQKINYSYINRFRACWVPDTSAAMNLAGSLSHPTTLPQIPVRYLNGLSRFSAQDNIDQKYDLLVVISGPEPQRSLLEKLILIDLLKYEGKVLFVRGMPGSSDQPRAFKQVTIVNHLAAEQLNVAFQQSEFIVSRSGYTTVMDIIKLKKKSVLIPTPGQTEQEYLADHLHKQKWCLNVPQHKFKLQEALEQASLFPYELPDLNMEEYKLVLDDFVSSLRK